MLTMAGTTNNNRNARNIGNTSSRRDIKAVGTATLAETPGTYTSVRTTALAGMPATAEKITTADTQGTPTAAITWPQQTQQAQQCGQHEPYGHHCTRNASNSRDVGISRDIRHKQQQPASKVGCCSYLYSYE
jgi:hypothetical protein